jgi:hypothetical protein
MPLMGMMANTGLVAGNPGQGGTSSLSALDCADSGLWVIGDPEGTFTLPAKGLEMQFATT